MTKPVFGCIWTAYHQTRHVVWSRYIVSLENYRACKHSKTDCACPDPITGMRVMVLPQTVRMSWTIVLFGKWYKLKTCCVKWDFAWLFSAKLYTSVHFAQLARELSLHPLSFRYCKGENWGRKLINIDALAGLAVVVNQPSSVIFRLDYVIS